MQYASIRRDGGAILSQHLSSKTSPKWHTIRQGCALLEQYRDLARTCGGVYQEIHTTLLNPSSSWEANLVWARRMAATRQHQAFEQLIVQLQQVLDQEAAS
jgi:hypothetical protein